MAFYINRSLGRKNCLRQYINQNQKYSWQSFLHREKESTKTGWRQRAQYTSSLLLGNCWPEWPIIVLMIVQTSDQSRFNSSCNHNIVYALSQIGSERKDGRTDVYQTHRHWVLLVIRCELQFIQSSASKLAKPNIIRIPPSCVHPTIFNFHGHNFIGNNISNRIYIWLKW